MKIGFWGMSVVVVAATFLTGAGCCPTSARDQSAGDALEQEFSASPTDYQAAIANRAQVKNQRPFEVLVLSGGGANGAWGAGFLNGWTASGKRPKFDVVTGVSTGALIATGAFIANDSMLEKAYTTTKNADVQRDRFFLAIPFSNSLKDSAPLKHLLTIYLTDDVINQVAQGAAENRRLYAGSVDLDSGKLIIWDLTKIANSKRPERYKLYRDVVLASASAPPLYPPVDLGGRLHVDGGVRASLFFRKYLLPRLDEIKKVQSPNPNLYVINDGTIGMSPQTTGNCLLPIAMRSISCLLEANGNAAIAETYHATVGLHHFHLSYIPPDVAPVDSFDFNPTEMTRLFRAGADYGKQEKWLPIPPEIDSIPQRHSAF